MPMTRPDVAAASHWLALAGAAVLCLLLLLPAAGCLAQTPPPVHWDFEDGTLQGWKVVSGNLPPQPTAASDDRWGDSFNKQGKYFIGTFEQPGPPGAGSDVPKGELRSPDFTIRYSHLAFLIGGGSDAATEYMSLVDAKTGQELLRATGQNAEKMRREVWDVSPYKGRRVYLRIVDASSAGWGHINVDDIYEMTDAEWAKLQAEKAKREAEARRKLALWQRSLWTGDDWRRPYTGDHTKKISMPLGGIGTGSLEITGTGDLATWQIFNRVNINADLPDSFFAVWAHAEGQPAVSRVLQVGGVPGWPGIKSTTFMGGYPFAGVSFIDDKLPVDVHLIAWSPMVPLDAKASSTPAVVLDYRVRNTSKVPVKVAVLGSLTNAVGWDGESTIEGVSNKDFGNNVARIVRVAGNQPVLGAREVLMSKQGQSPEEPTFGTMALAGFATHTEPRRAGAELIPGRVTCVPEWRDIKALRADFDHEGALGELRDRAPNAPTPKGQTANAAVAVGPLNGVPLKPGQSFEATFVIAWDFPWRLRAWDWGPADIKLHNTYANYFADANAVVSHVCGNLGTLLRDSAVAARCLWQSDLPPWLREALGVHIASIRTPLVMWVDDALKPGGVVAAFEGLSDKGGCCPMNCTHVWNYAQTMAYVWPSMERNVRELDLGPQLQPDGGVRHRLQLPLSLPRKFGPFADGQLSTILKCYREVRNCPDDKWLDANWPHIRRAMDYALKVYDPDGDGVIEGEQWNTYDCAIYGANTFIGSLYLAALRAAEEMALRVGDRADARRYRDRFEVGRVNLDKKCWREDLGYYVQVYDAKKHPATQYGIGCLSDQLIGQWWAHMLDLGYILPKDHVLRALQSIYKYNFKYGWTFEPYSHTEQGEDMGLLNCSWPFGGRPARPILYCDGAWTGVEYEVAAEMIYEGMVTQGLTIARGARDRYDGLRRNPYDEMECGHHYARPLSSWSLLLALSGVSVDGPRGALHLRKLPAAHTAATYPLTTPTGWGTIRIAAGRAAVAVSIGCRYGTMHWQSVRVPLPKAAQDEVTNYAEALIGDSRVPCHVTRAGDGTAVVTFDQPVALQEGRFLDVDLRPQP